MAELLRRRLIVVIIVVLAVLLLSANRIALFLTDWWWYASAGAGDVFTGMLRARLVLGIAAALVLGILIAVNLQIARRMRPLIVPTTPQQAIIETYRAKADPFLKWIVAAIAILFGASSGFAAATQWKPFLLWQNSTSFGLDDPQFGKDVGFFVFELPFLRLVQGWLFTSLVLVALLTAGAHFLLGGIRPDAPRDRVLPSVKAHLSVLLALLLAARGWGYWLDRYELNYSPRGTVTGAAYTDVNAELPALMLLMVVTAVAIALTLYNLRRPGFLLPGAAIGLLVLASILLQGVYPAVVQRLRVDPQELEREAEYIDRNRAMTLEAYDLADLELPTFTVSDDLSAEDVSNNDATFTNIRLWDPNLLRDNYEELQALRPYYEFNDVDIDRYEIDGEVRQVMLAARELDSAGISGAWQNEHLTFTHGYGIVASQVNTATTQGQPVFLAKDIPPVAGGAAPSGELVAEQPGLYFGDRGYPSYSIVDTNQLELDYEEPGTQQQVSTNYSGLGGVELGGRIRRLMFALRFSDPNFVLSGLLNSDSRVIFNRHINERVSAMAPYLTLDNDPYPVVLDGRTLWVQDAYTTSTNYPYSQETLLQTGLDLHPVNYIRNSVKAVVDAYDGTVTLYQVDTEDPIATAWRNAFPNAYADVEDAPAGLQDHFKYPEDLFRLQSQMYAKYHIPDTAAFYNGADQWEIPRDAAAAENRSDNSTPPLTPYYMLMKLPGEEAEEFVAIQPYVPLGKDNMIAWLAARSDPDHYGELFAVQFPTNSNVLGPVQAHARIEQESLIAREFTLVDDPDSGSQLLRGNLLVLPIESSIVFVEPLFLQNNQSRIPELWNVVLVMGDRVVMRPTLAEALNALVSGGGAISGGGSIVDDPDDPTSQIEDPEELIRQALEAFAAADEALRDGNLALYQSRVDRAQRLLERAAALQGIEVEPEPEPETEPEGTEPPAVDGTEPAAEETTALADVG